MSMSLLQRIKSKFVSLVYADHNQGATIQKALGSCLRSLDENSVGLNVGAGGTKLDPRIKNLDLRPGEHIDYVCDASAIPVPDDTFDLVISQETLEHVADPWKVMAEMHRVLKPGGKIYCQLPFVIGYHPGPTDFWRFSKEGIQQLVEQSGFKTEEIGIAVGASTGFYRICVEYFSVLASVVLPPFYKFFKGVFALVFYPIKWLDGLMNLSPERDRIPGGYYVIARK